MKKIILWAILGILLSCSGHKVSSEIKGQFKKVAFVSNYQDSVNYYTSIRNIWRADGSNYGLIGALVAEAVSGYDKEKLTTIKMKNHNDQIQKYLDSFVKENAYTFKVESLKTKNIKNKDEIILEAKKQKFSHVFVLNAKVTAQSALPQK